MWLSSESRVAHGYVLVFVLRCSFFLHCRVFKKKKSISGMILDCFPFWKRDAFFCDFNFVAFFVSRNYLYACLDL